MFGVLAVPAHSIDIGVLIVVGGPQYRIGSHRQFVLLARALATAQVPSLRFDHRGMGDSGGTRQGFEHIASDIDAAVDALCDKLPRVKGVVLLGLCDGASASALYAPTDRRIAGLVLFNPWVRTPSGEAEAMVRHYYARRVMNAQFWRKLFRGGIEVRTALRDFRRTARFALGTSARGRRSMETLPYRIGDALSQYRGPVLFGLSGNDRVAEEFRLAAARAGKLADVQHASRSRTLEFGDADHTFSSRRHRDEMTRATIDWLNAHFGDSFARLAETVAAPCSSHEGGFDTAESR